ncbi:MAG: LysM peptidoglycan-binding domain-containing protein [Chlamydiales bacterium]|nr:LysM peptidoglycan-binding domain-containing protein [Chlamydiales bacterium]
MGQKWIRQVLALSLVLNVALLSLFFYFLVRENRLSLLFAYKPVEEMVPPILEELQKTRDPKLLQTFAQSADFTLVQTLFARADHDVSRGTLLQLVLEGNQETLSRFTDKQKGGADFSAPVRQQFLLDHIALGSKTAAYLLVLLDPDYALLLSNEKIEHLFELMDEPTPEAIAFTEQVLGEKRSPRVDKHALERLAQYTGQSQGEIAARYDRYLNNENLRPVFRQQVPITQTQQTHIVQPGESLWLIAKKYHVTIEKIMVTNNLRSTTLQPGKMLKIPSPD